jgi:hypothetical protein
MATSTLRRADFKTDSWERLRTYLETRRAELREQIEGDADHDTTIKLRGRIAELTALLRLEKAPAEVPRTGAVLSVDQLIPQQGDEP